MAQPPGGSPLPRGERRPPGGALGAPQKTRVLGNRVGVALKNTKLHVSAGGGGGTEAKVGDPAPPSAGTQASERRIQTPWIFRIWAWQGDLWQLLVPRP